MFCVTAGLVVLGPCSSHRVDPGRTAVATSARASHGRSASSAPTPTTARAAKRTGPAAPSAIGTTVLNLVDTSRRTVSHGRVVAPVRVLTTHVWYPQGPAVPHPLVVFAHGYRVGLAPYRRVCLALARRGFVVAAPIFALSDPAVAGPLLDEDDMVNEPADVSFVITQLLAASVRGAQPLGGRIDPAQIALVGHSDGATVALELGYLPAARDARIRLVVADAPSALPLPEGAENSSGRVRRRRGRVPTAGARFRLGCRCWWARRSWGHEGPGGCRCGALLR